MDINKYFSCKLSKDKKLLMAAISLLKGLKAFKGCHEQIIFDNLMTRVEIAEKCQRQMKGPTKTDMELVN